MAVWLGSKPRSRSRGDYPLLVLHNLVLRGKVEPGQGLGVLVEAEVLGGEDLGKALRLQDDPSGGGDVPDVEEVEQGMDPLQKLGVRGGDGAPFVVLCPQQVLHRGQLAQQAVVAPWREVVEPGGQLHPVEVETGPFEDVVVGQGQHPE